MNKNLNQSITGSLLGTAVGDAIGLACEGMTRKRRARMFPDADRYHFVFGKGMTSDDTEHACMTAQALIASGGDPARFSRSLAWRLRLWFLGLPAGIGFATLRAILKLWIGFPPRWSGVNSAGNGPAMRSPIIGVAYGSDPAKMKELVRASTRLTHTHPSAEQGALAAALAAHMAATRESPITPDEYFGELRKLLGESSTGFMAEMDKVAKALADGLTPEAFADSRGLEKGITGYIMHTIPAALFCWLRNQKNLRAGIVEIVKLGGDTDTTAAILGGIIGAGVGESGVPKDWLDGLMEWPRSVGWIRRLGEKLSAAVSGQSTGTLALFVPGVLARNIFFMVVVLLHGFRRMLPPY